MRSFDLTLPKKSNTTLAVIMTMTLAQLYPNNMSDASDTEENIIVNFAFF